MGKNSLFFFILTLMVVSCGPETFESADELVRFINDKENNFRYEKCLNDFSCELIYRPTDLMVKQELGDDYDAKKVEELRKKYNQYMYFNLSMSINKKELLSDVAYDREKFRQVLNDLAFGMEDKICLYTPEKDTLIMTDFVYPRMYGMSNSTSVMIVYPKDEKLLKKEYLNFTIQDLGFHTGEIKFKIRTKSILNEPNLRFN